MYVRCGVCGDGSEVQRIVATEGQIYISSIPAAVQDFQS